LRSENILAKPRFFLWRHAGWLAQCSRGAACLRSGQRKKYMSGLNSGKLFKSKMVLQGFS